MANVVRNARKHLERVGNLNSLKNVKTRRAALEMARAICRSYPAPPSMQIIREETVIEELPRGYSLTFRVGNVHFSFPGDTEHRVRGYCFSTDHDFQKTWGQSNPDSRADLVAAERLARDVADGLLLDIHACIVATFGREAAAKFWSAVY